MRRAVSHVLVVAMLSVVAAGPRAQAPGAEHAITVETATGTLAGTLLLPGAPTRPPVVLIIAGSGPTDRDGNSTMLPGKNNSLKMLAESLAAAGIASVRYDKRGLGGSRAAGAGGEASLRFDGLVDDAAAWITLLRNDPRFPVVAVAGHSEGSLIGLLATRLARADGFISIAGAGKPAAVAIRDQMRPQLAALPALATASESILTALEAGQLAPDVPQLLSSLFRPSVQPYLISWFKYSPPDELGRLVVPALIVQGTTDVQIPAEDAKLLAAAKPDAALAMVDGMNHVLKMVGGDIQAQLPSYSDPNLPLAPAVPAAIAPFVKGLPQFGRTGGSPRPAQERRSPRRVTVAAIGAGRVGIEYGSPQQRGREIWGALVPWSQVWMPGADEASALTTSKPLTIGGLEVPPGDYSIYTLPSPAGVQLIISKDVGQFHTVYRRQNDLGRVPMTLEMMPSPVEGLTFGLESGEGGGRLTLSWADRKYSVAIVARQSQ